MAQIARGRDTRRAAKQHGNLGLVARELLEDGDTDETSGGQVE